MENEIITLKGTGDGIKMYLDKNAPFSEILTAVNEKIKAWRSFFGAGHCHMYFLGRDLSKSDMLRLETVVKALLPESIIVYDEKNIGDTVQLPKQFLEQINQAKAPAEKDAEEKDSADGENADNVPPEGDAENSSEQAAEAVNPEEMREFERAKDVITTNYKSSRARLYEGTVKSGRVVESDGHMVLVGNVEEGGTVIANGNVIILGALMGSAQAGCMGNADSYVIALDMQPTDLRIAHVNRKYYKGEFTKDSLPKRAYLTKDEICIKEFLLNI